MARWAELRADAVVAAFCAAMRSERFTSPPARAALLSKLQVERSAALRRIEGKLLTLSEHFPPGSRFGVEPTAAWAAQLTRLLDEWDARRAELLTELEADKAATDSEAAALWVASQADLVDEGIWSEADAPLKAAAEALPCARLRQATAAAELAATRGALEAQATEWRRRVAACEAWLGGLAATHAAHKEAAAAAHSSAVAALADMTAESGRSIAQLEEQLQLGRAAMAYAADGSALEEATAGAMVTLDAIKAGYRSFHAAACGLVGAQPGRVAALEEAYAGSLLPQLFLRSSHWAPLEQQASASSLGAAGGEPEQPAAEASSAKIPAGAPSKGGGKAAERPQRWQRRTGGGGDGRTAA